MSSNQRRPVYALALAMLLVVVSWVAPSSSAQAPLDFKLKTTDGGEITSEMVRGDVVVLAFGSSLLGPLSKQQAQGVQELAEQFGPRDVRVYWVTTDSDKPQARNYATDEQLRAFASKAGLKAAILRDPEGALFKKTGADQLPAVVILDRHGAVSVPVVGGHDPKHTLVEALSDRLNKMLAVQ
ncbi:MAG: TlpA family protein disulfide reductase [Acidobacteria bacterium]|nr:TlpA family protein disulfide reductase [Acidobacteriota bacterium]